MIRTVVSKARFSLSALAVVAAMSLASGATAKTFAFVDKALNDPFSAPAKDGCEKAAKELGVECIYMGPAEPDEGKQIQMLNDMITRGVDGIAVAALNPKAAARILAKAKQQGIPVVTYDSDLLPEDEGLRATFIGMDNYQFGVELAKKVHEYKPKGGTVCIQSGTPGSVNLDLRVQGVRDYLGGADKAHPVLRLNGENGWTEPPSCPIYNNDNIATSIQQLNDVLTAYPALDALVAVGGWAQYAPSAYRTAIGRVKQRVDSKDLVISFGDAFAPQMPLLKEGLSHYQVGQSPYRMGYEAIKALVDLSNGKTVPAYIDTGFLLCTPDMADTCGKE